jgi:ABC-type Fe3+ transport system permease subunit
MYLLKVLALFVCGFWVLVGLFVTLVGHQAANWLQSRYNDIPAVRFITSSINTGSIAVGAAIIAFALVILLIVGFH